MAPEKEKSAVRMRISFDLDEVIFVDPRNHKTEPRPGFPLDHIFTEYVRYGTPYLINELQKQGFEVWVYTSSFRSEHYIKKLFRHYGIKFDGIVNGQRHAREVQGKKAEPMPTKLPSFYRISLHVDDESVVVTYGRHYGFDVYQLDAQDDEWAEKIIKRAHQIKKKQGL